MARDYQARKYIAEMAAQYSDQNLTDVLIKAFDIICSHKESSGCMSTSAALHVVLHSLGYEPKFCYGLCVSPAGNEFYHAWLELDNKVLDLAIYGNSHFSTLWLDEELGPVVFEEYQNTPIRYYNHRFDEDWDNCMIASAVKMGTIAAYISRAPFAPHPTGNAMWMLIFDILNETFTSDRYEALQSHVSCEKL